MTQILVGCDPEVFVRQNGLFRSAHGLIPGDKKSPFKVRNGAVQVDGMALEFNIDPAATEDQFVLSVQDVFQQMAAMVPGYEVVAVPVADFDPDYMKSQPKEALELGCDPDFNAWTGAPFVKPNADLPMRTASGHVHIGWTNGERLDDQVHAGNARAVTKQMDFFLGLGSLFYDGDVRRRSMYGKGGCHRVKSYGVEYRTLSNAWLLNEQRMRWVYRQVQKGMESLMNGNDLSQRYGDVQEIINTSNKAEAERILKAENMEIPCGL